MSADEKDYVMKWKIALGQQLALERKDQKLNQTQVAESLGLSQRTVSQVERGESPTIDHFLRYCELIDVDFAVLAARARVVVRSRELDQESLLA